MNLDRNSLICSIRMFVRVIHCVFSGIRDMHYQLTANLKYPGAISRNNYVQSKGNLDSSFVWPRFNNTDTRRTKTASIMLVSALSPHWPFLGNFKPNNNLYQYALGSLLLCLHIVQLYLHYVLLIAILTCKTNWIKCKNRYDNKS